MKFKWSGTLWKVWFVNWCFTIHISFQSCRFAQDWSDIDGLLVQDCSISSVLVMEILQSCIKPSITHWGRDKMAAVWQTTLSNAFSWMQMLEFRLRFHWSLFLRAQLAIFQPLSKPMMVSLLTHICVTRPQWVIPFGSSGWWLSA